ncbi:collagenase 3-like [Antedon mediterranea]|uniref:collagenase 3-like n=1 Tax=Antedon mediterranea TaxID=105859 RepID=UPI003AF4A003
MKREKECPLRLRIAFIISAFLSLLHVSSGGPITVDKRAEESRGFLVKYGYMGDGGNTNDLTAGDSPTFQIAVKRMQEFSGLKQTGEVNDETYELMRSARCGFPDVIRLEDDGGEGSGDEGIAPEEFKTGRKWKKTVLTYRISAYTKDLPPEVVDDALRRAFQVWSDVTPLVFIKEDSGKVDIEVSFTGLRHTDRFYFDGKGGTLAHAFQPTGWGDLDGDVHFDDSETYTVESKKGTNLFQVAAHEIGHALGLSHSKDSSALMAPYYKGYIAAYRLPIDDVMGIQSLYGKNSNPPNPKPTYTVKEPDACSKEFDALLNMGDLLCAFREDKLWLIRRTGDRNTVITTDKLEGDLITNHLPITGPFDASYQRKSDEMVILLKGRTLYEYNINTNTYTQKGLRTISTSLPSSIDAALTSDSGLTYFFKWDRVFLFDENTKSIEKPKHITDVFPGIPDNISGAFNGNDGYYYFVQEYDVFKYNVNEKRVEDGYPKSFSKTYIGCEP